MRARAHWPLCFATSGRVFVAGIFIPVGNHYFQALASTLQFVAQVARPRHRQSVFVAACHFLIIFFYVAATCRPSVLGSATKTRTPVSKQSGQCARALRLFLLFKVEINDRKTFFGTKFFATYSMYHRKQIKWYPQRCLLVHLCFDLPIITKVKFVTAVKFHYRVLQLTAVFLTPLG